MMQKKITYGGMGTALCVLLLAMSAYLPTGRAASLFLSSAICYTMCFIADRRTAFAMYLASVILSFIIMPGAVAIVTFAICFGNYPLIKSYIDSKPLKLQLVSKYILYTLYCLVVYYTFKLILNITIPYAPALLYTVGILIFAFYDWLLANTGRYIIQLLRK